ncbi:ATP-binding protein [Rickettsia endosymbiont of Ceutorhynchus obstrictus]|uniref:ATP-binding protein n=1 Tax=Rickettsia endosymbiont of Ceutorhynchus obstrictus TaxID=3066249 RepID=UPI0031333A41
MYNRYLKLHLEKKQTAFLWGARKVGKSTYLKNLYPESVYYDLLKTDLQFKYLKQPSMFREEILALDTQKLTFPIIVDEVQKVPALLDEIHWLIENTDSYFILCGSSSRKLRSYGTNLLGGRAIKYNFYPLVYPEIKEEFNLLRIFNHGLIPLHFINNNPRKLLKAYVEDYLTNEIRAEGLVRNITAFSRFMDSTAFSHGELLNYSNIARDCYIDAKTVKEYYQILIDTLVGYLIYPYTKKVNREIISSTPKFYFFDVGIASNITENNFDDLKGAAAGKALEHYVFTELKAYINLNDLDHRINYWRTKTGLEVDFIISTIKGKPLPIEVKISSNLHKSELRGMKAFMEEHKLDKGYIICLEETPRKIYLETQEINILPIKEFLKRLWKGDIF